MKLTYAIWNILAGGVDAGGDARLRWQMALLASLSPLVVGLQECRYWDRDYHRTFHLAGQLLGMRGFLSLSEHHGCHLAVFIWENAGLRVIEQRHEHGNPYWHAARIVAQASGLPAPIQLASVHLAPSSPVIRLAEAEALGLMPRTSRRSSAATSTHSRPVTPPEPPETGGHGRRKLDRGPAQALEEAGFLDLGARTGDLTPTVGHAGDLPYRCDRIYTTLPAETITGYQVITSADSESDHRPSWPNST